MTHFARTGAKAGARLLGASECINAPIRAPVSTAPRLELSSGSLEALKWLALLLKMCIRDSITGSPLAHAVALRSSVGYPWQRSDDKLSLNGRRRRAAVAASPSVMSSRRRAALGRSRGMPSAEDLARQRRRAVAAPANHRPG